MPPAPPSVRTTGRRSAAESVASIDLSKRDLSLDLARVVCVLLVVLIHLLFVGVAVAPDGALIISRPLEEQPWFPAATWVGQIMPLFFVVGGFASLTAWRSLRRRGGSGADYVRNRVLRLAQPAFPLYVFWAVALIVGYAIAAAVPFDPEVVTGIANGAGSPLWFLAAYTICQALVPLAVRAHALAPRGTIAALALGVVAVDTLRFASGITEIGLLNLFLVWPLVQQLGFWYADGWFARRRGLTLVGIALGCYLLLGALVAWGPYSPDMLTNLNPPTVPLVLLGLAQACLLRLAKPALQALMRRRVARAIVFLAGTRLMTIYLWHLPVILALTGLALLIPGATPEPSSALWWWTRIPGYLIVFGALFALSLLVGRWEAPREVGPTPPAWVVGLASAASALPSAYVLQYFLDLPIAIVGSVLIGGAILVLGRWPRGRGGADTASVGRSGLDAEPSGGEVSSPTAR